MTPLVRFATYLYPRSWRERYGMEFSALLEDVRPDSRALVDIMRGALQMQMTSWNAGRILVVGGMLGALAALGASYLIPKTYVSQAVLKITPAAAPSTVAADIDRGVTDRINELSQIIFSRTVLATMMQEFGLYQGERSRMPIEDVIELMRKNIAILPVQRIAGAPPPRVPAFAIQFSYQDRFVAQRVTQDLVSRSSSLAAGSLTTITRKDIRRVETDQYAFKKDIRVPLVEALSAFERNLDAVSAEWEDLRRNFIGTVPAIDVSRCFPALNGLVLRQKQGGLFTREIGAQYRAALRHLQSNKANVEAQAEKPSES